jgi:hypothetical protein
MVEERILTKSQKYALDNFSKYLQRFKKEALNEIN